MGISFLNCPNYRVLCSFDSGFPWLYVMRFIKYLTHQRAW
jgi:hypothetical protein